MLSKGFIKPEVSIKNISKTKFWSGIVFGLLISFVLSCFFNYSRESLRAITLCADLLILPENESRLYDLFFAALSSSLAFGFTIIVWLRGQKVVVRKRYLRRLSITNAFFVLSVVFMSVTRFGSVLPLILFGRAGYDNQLNLLSEFWLLLLLLPVYVFVSHWNTVRLIFRTHYWIVFSIIIYLATTFVLFKITNADRNILNQVYYSRNEYRFTFIDSEFEKAKKMGILFSDSTSNILQKKYAERTIDLVMDLKVAFETQNKVSMDTLVLEKIVVHNMNRHQQVNYGRNSEQDKNWPYALPEQLYGQIQKYDVDCSEVRVLFEILNEQILLFTAPELNWNERTNYSIYEKEKSLYKRSLIYSTSTIQSRLVQVVDKLRSGKRYQKYHKLLPEISFNDYGGLQKYQALSLD